MRFSSKYYIYPCNPSQITPPFSFSQKQKASLPFLVLLCDRQERGRMLGLKAFMLCLVFGALTRAQSAECSRECSRPGLLSQHEKLVHALFILWVVDLFSFFFSVGKNECPIDLYFTIDTSETIALQESPPGALVEGIKVLLFDSKSSSILINAFVLDTKLVQNCLLMLSSYFHLVIQRDPQIKVQNDEENQKNK